ncbi:lipocalin-like domain-containing protein [Prevotella sp. AGR2160]|uniref:lipocalin-like domain-containing protein n=1 Tax=Prevotella sp. AGR2160 TaxID=1280674 RepID=UPI00040ABA2F|nr:DUF4923 family protein [Prevotella sp. AGR2160]
MKKNVLSAAAIALMLMTGAGVNAEAATLDDCAMDQMMAMPAKKTAKKTKKTTKKSTKTTSKKSTKKTTSSTTTATATASSATTTESTASNGLGSLLGGLASGLSTIFNANKTATVDDLAGTWSYTEPAVVFSDDNVLKEMAGKIASASIESKLAQEYEKFGIKKGAMKMTFDKDGNFTQTIGGKTISGTYKINGQNVTLSYLGGLKQLVGTTQLDGNDLLIVVDATKALSTLKVLGALTGNSVANTVGNLVGSYKGLKIGVKLDK